MPSWRALEVPRSWELNTGKISQGIRRSDGFSKKLKENNQKGIIEILKSRWRVLIPVRGVYVLGRIVWCTI